MPNYTKIVHFYKLITLKHKKVVEQFVYYGEKHSFIEWTCCRYKLELPHRGNSNVYQQHMLLKLRKRILKYTLNKYHVHWLSSFNGT